MRPVKFRPAVPPRRAMIAVAARVVDRRAGDRVRGGAALEPNGVALAGHARDAAGDGVRAVHRHRACGERVLDAQGALAGRAAVPVRSR